MSSNIRIVKDAGSGGSMPTYDYKCMLCNEIKSVVKSIHEPLTKQKCKKCKVEMARMYSNVGVIFNGGGWAGKTK